jgi:hypothetical protein
MRRRRAQVASVPEEAIGRPRKRAATSRVKRREARTAACGAPIPST